MAAEFIAEEFLLETEEARRLYHEYAEGLPIIDYHCHLPVEEIARDRRWDNITQIWLNGDHYKWRAMRSNGVDERFCTGDAPDREKFQKWAETMPCALRNPLYHWTHLEMKRYFGISDRLLGPDTAESIWEECNAKLAGADFSARGLIKSSNVVLICTTDDPLDCLEHHKAIAADDGFSVKVLPTWRPDAGMAVENIEAFNEWVDRLAGVSDTDIGNLEAYLEAIDKRHAVFHEAGCRLSDHGLDRFYADDYSLAEIECIFANVRSGKALSVVDGSKFKSAMLHEFALLDHGRGWTQQFHYGAMRDNNSRMMAQLGPNTGFDSVGDERTAEAMSKFLDKLDRKGKLARTIIYNLNPRDNALVATMMGNFQDGSVPGKMQMGSGWWFMDQKDGMERQIEVLSQIGLLSRFVGMVTDSRSFLSYTRHEYFRRILCNILGNDMAAGLIPRDMELVGRMVGDIAYNNAANYFGFDV